MTKLKLGPLSDDKPVKVALELPASLHRDLAAYAEILSRGAGQTPTDPIRLIAPMLQRFIATDRGFAKAKRATMLNAKSTPCLRLPSRTSHDLREAQQRSERRIIVSAGPDGRKWNNFPSDRSVCHAGNSYRRFGLANERDTFTQRNEIEDIVSSNPLNIDANVSFNLANLADNILSNLLPRSDLLDNKRLLGERIPRQFGF